MTEKLDKIINRVQGLLAKAASTNFPAEAESLRAKADELMTNYAIEQWQLERAQRQAQGARPTAVKSKIDISWYWETDDRDVASGILSVLYDCAAHTRVELAYLAVDYDEGVMPCVGMVHDIEYFKVMFTDLWVQMMAKLDPHPKEGEPMIEALARMKEAGMKWEDIYYRLQKHGYFPEDQPWQPSKMNFAGKYTKFCEENRRPRVRVTPAVYRRSFIAGFESSLRRKLADMREGQGQSSGTRAIALRDYREDVKQALYDFFPEHKPVERDPGAEGKPKKSRARKPPKPKTMSFDAMLRGSEAGKEITVISQGQDSYKVPEEIES